MNATKVGISLGMVCSQILLFFPAAAQSKTLDAVCATDEQTLASIRSSQDQTLWTFMQSVCEGNFQIVSRPSLEPQPIASVTEKTMSVETAAQQAAESYPALPVDLLAGPIDSSQHSASLVITPQVEIGTQSGGQVSKAKEMAGVTAEMGAAREETSISSLLYSLIDGPNAVDATAESVTPIPFEQSRFAGYRPDYLEGVAASVGGSGTIKRPGVMTPAPLGFYLGTSLHWERDREDHTDDYSALPSLIVGYADERAVRDHTNFLGWGFRTQLLIERTKGESRSGSWSSFELTSELYQPLGNGFFSGLGAEYGRVRSIPMQDYGRYDGSGWGVYLPIGFGFTSVFDHSGKIQLNTLLAAKTKIKYSQLTGANFSDPSVNYHFGDRLQLNFDYSLSPAFELFVHNEWLRKPRSFTYTEDGVRVTGRHSRQWRMEVGIRRYW